MFVPGVVASTLPSSPQRFTTVTAPDVASLQPTPESPSNRGGVRVRCLTPWVTEDLRKAQYCDTNGVDGVLKYFLQRASKHPDNLLSNTSLLDKCLEKVLPICNGQGDNQSASTNMRCALKTYTEAATETGMYTPFTDMTNAALESLRGLEIDGMRHPVSEMEIAFQRNDRAVIAQDHSLKTSHHKPDVIVVSKLAKHSEEAGNDGSYADIQTNRTKDKSKIYWQDVFSVVEFKRQKPMRPPPQKYAVLPRTDAVDPMTELDDPPSGQAAMVEGVQSGKSSQGPSLKRPPDSDDLVEHPAKQSSGRSQDHSAPAEPPIATNPPAQIQAALYAAEMMSANVTVNYVINFIVRDDEIWIWMYDHQSAISAGGFNFVQDLPRFVVLLFVLQRFQLAEFVRSADFKVHGRGTDVMDLICPEFEDKDQCLKGDDVVGKIHWDEELRESEATILDAVKGHVPIVLLSHKFSVSMSTTRMALGIMPDDAKGGSRFLIFPKLRPITELQPKPKELLDVWVQCILCHYTLWKCGVHHHDVSATNLMYYRVNGTLKGVLSDYDLAALAGSERKLGNEQTGTIPFMAIDLLRQYGQNGEVEHRYRHDVESFVWVFIWVSCQYKDGKFHADYLTEWAIPDATQCAMHKKFYLHILTKQKPRDLTAVVRYRVTRYACGILDQLSLRKQREEDLAYARRRREDAAPSEVAELQASILQLEGELNEKDDEVFREFAKLIKFKDTDAVIQRATEAMVTLE